jgi:glycosyltransferase involved in cell wall biosynthesis
MIALVSTVKNEAGSDEAKWQLLDFLASIERQTRRPDLMVITDGGSTDETLDILKSCRDSGMSYMRVIPLGGGNRSFGRNEAIREAMQEGADIIACTNVSVLNEDWLERIVAPIEYSDDIDVVGGGYRIDTETLREWAAAKTTQYSHREARDKKFVSALSMAFTVEVWKNVGGFPEELDTSEDTVFVRRLRDAACGFHYEPTAIVHWRPSTLTVRGAYKTYKQFAETDYKAKVNERQYIATLLAYLMPFMLAIVGAPLTGLFGYFLWLVYRCRKAGIFGIPYAVAVDMARIKGYWGKFFHG